MIRVALAGNPNVGKSVIFNSLTGGRQKVGNWPGKTVEKREGFFEVDGEEVLVVDLPGTYSLTAYSVEELIARNYILEEQPDVVVVVVDASNLERNLYLVLQVIELGARVVLALNKMDLAEASNIRIDVKELESLLGVPVVPTVAPRGLGLDELRRKIIEVARAKKQATRLAYAEDFERALSLIMEHLREIAPLKRFNARWLAIKLLEGDNEVVRMVSAVPEGKEVLRHVKVVRRELEERHGDLELALISERYRVIKRIVERVVSGEKRLEASDALDQALLDKYLGLPVFVSLLWVMFQFTFIVSAPFSDMLGDFFAILSERLRGVTGVSYLDYVLFGEYGVLNGIGTVLSFLPIIAALYFVLSLFEDFGYMARAAFLMDRVMRKLGLAGQAIIPMILGFGCNIAGVYGARIIPSEEDRVTAIVTNPLMLCSARLTAFTVIVAAFWGAAGGSVLLSLYLLGVTLAFLVALALRVFILRKSAPSPLVMELPPYQLPSLKVAITQMCVRASLFFRKAGTIILLGLLVIGLLATTDSSTFSFTLDVERSVLASLGRSLQPVFAPLGWDWRLVVAVIFGFIAKEIVIGATSMLYGVAEDELPSLLSQYYDPVTMYSYMVFVLVYTPCIATLAAIRHETQSWKWTAFTIAYEVALAYVLSLLVLALGRALFGGSV